MIRFDSIGEATEAVASVVDTPIENASYTVGAAMLTASHFKHPDGQYTNIYDLAFRDADYDLGIHLPQNLSRVGKHVKRDENVIAAISGGFFYLVDSVNSSPLCMSLNLSLSKGRVKQLPNCDQEALLIEDGTLKSRIVRAQGSIAIAGNEITWKGANAKGDADGIIYSNGLINITHSDDARTGKKRVLQHDSRYSPERASDEVDVGLILEPDDRMRVVSIYGADLRSDIFAYHALLRLPKSFGIKIGDMASVKSIDGVEVTPKLSAVSTGPMLNIPDIEAHQINRDRSLGSYPPFLDERKARAVYYRSPDGMSHLSLFDARPQSDVFTGMTPDEVSRFLRDEHGEVEGCFLDPGQSARMAVRDEHGKIQRYGNRHYVKWPKNDSGSFKWSPKKGRPVGSIVELRQHADDN